MVKTETSCYFGQNDLTETSSPLLLQVEAIIMFANEVYGCDHYNLGIIIITIVIVIVIVNVFVAIITIIIPIIIISITIIIIVVVVNIIITSITIIMNREKLPCVLLACLVPLLFRFSPLSATQLVGHRQHCF